MTAGQPYLAWLKKAEHSITTSDGNEVEVYELEIDLEAGLVLSAWAKHFREHYCLDSQIDRLRRGTNKSR
ncbi:DUF1837 domain-containing protein, partial [Salmonella enterica subsp. enterica serovar Enteritidis]|nr:DUF1837 domain-containing protein [Salmonella enterica subsp. enterica serovar Enteritidis]